MHHLQKDLKLNSCTAAHKPLLTNHMRKSGLVFVKQSAKWTTEEWSKVMWSDEGTFQLIPSQHVKLRHPSPAGRYDAANTSPTVKHWECVMVWACFSGAFSQEEEGCISCHSQGEEGCISCHSQGEEGCISCHSQ